MGAYGPALGRPGKNSLPGNAGCARQFQPLASTPQVLAQAARAQKIWAL
jgi:hypothetical protein